VIQTLFGPPPPTLRERFQKAVESTRSALSANVEDLIQGKVAIDPALLDGLEEALIRGDVGVGTAQQVLESVRNQVTRGKLAEPSGLKSAVKAELLNILKQTSNGAARAAEPPLVILIVGVNGTGKTTTIGKLAWQFRSEGRKVLLCAGDTFRAAAVEQLEIWGQRTGCEVIKQRPGADPSAVLFDALTAGKARNYDCVIADTAGRLHTKVNLMAELEKMRRTCARIIPGSPHEVLLVLDATTGQNGLQQARLFTAASGVTGIVLTKLDGTAKGGIVIAIARELKLPIRFVGVGEQKDDLLPFHPEQFIESLFS
jgi:fused signal recognition particle receptor